MFHRALKFAAYAHRQATRADGKTQYVVHPARVTGILRGFFMQGDVLTAAALHEVVRRTDVRVCDIEQSFGTAVAQLVSDVTVPATVPEYLAEQWLIDHAPLLSQDAADIVAASEIDEVLSLAWEPPRWSYLTKMRRIGEAQQLCRLLPASKELVAELDSTIREVRRSLLAKAA